MLCGAESWESIEMFGKSKKDFLFKILKLSNGIPSHDTINRVFSLIRADKFEQLFTQWAQSLKDSGISKEVISVVGKTIRGSRDTYHDKAAIHLVNAWVNSNGLVLGQVRAEEKTSEITAQREIRDTVTMEIRLYISSVEAGVKEFNSYIRQHWAVENLLHWTLDVTFREDKQRKRNGKAAQNFALVQKIALNLLKKEESKRMSLKTKRLVAAWDNEFLLKILTI